MNAWCIHPHVGELMESNTVMPTKDKVKPVHEVRLGFVKAAIWRNDTESGPRFNSTFSRLYREGEDWRSTESFGRDDLLLLGKVADQAHSWICAQGQDRAEREGREER